MDLIPDMAGEVDIQAALFKLGPEKALNQFPFGPYYSVFQLNGAPVYLRDNSRALKRESWQESFGRDQQSFTLFRNKDRVVKCSQIAYNLHVTYYRT